MRNVVLIMTVSIDGFVVAPKGHAGRLPEPNELQHWKLDRIRRAGTHIMGRVTYEQMASFWPTSADEAATASSDRRAPSSIRCHRGRIGPVSSPLAQFTNAGIMIDVESNDEGVPLKHAPYVVALAGVAMPPPPRAGPLHG